MRQILAGFSMILFLTAVPHGGQAASLCGIANNFTNGLQGKVRVKRFRVSGESVDGRLVCSHWKTICNGRVGTIHGTLGTIPALPGAQVIQGTLTYGKQLICGVYCQVEGVAGGDDTQYFCQFNCPDGSAARQVSFTVQRRCL